MTRRLFLSGVAVAPLALLASKLPSMPATTHNFTMKYIPPGIHNYVYCGVHGYSAKWQFTNAVGKTTYHGMSTSTITRNDEVKFAELVESYIDISKLQVQNG